jgi:tetratricopeptide (TPR) repeat protein
VKPRVFVVMPFRDKQVRIADPPDQKAVFVNFDDVYNLFIRPVLAEAGCEPFRADEEKVAGDIRTDMFFELVTADIVLADVSILNTNVFYELGIRHGVAPRGVITVHGGWDRQPFDIAPDRLIPYDGSLWDKTANRDEGWRKKLEVEKTQLIKSLSIAIAEDKRSEGSPVYKNLPGLKPVDWRELHTAKAKYFQGILHDWRSRVKVAMKRGAPGDILTLAGDAPTRYHQETLLFAAAKGLIDLQRFDPAPEVLKEVLEMDPDHLEARCQLALVLNRLGKADEARALVGQASQENRGQPELQGVLGRVYKDMWRHSWADETDPEARKQAAVASSNLAALAVRSYELAQRTHLDSYHNGINVIAIQSLLDRLRFMTKEEPADTGLKDLQDITAVVRVAATAALERSRSGLEDQNQQEAAWAMATLGELALLQRDSERDSDTARRFYRDAVVLPDITYFQLHSMRSQLELYRDLGFQSDLALSLIQILDNGLKRLPNPARCFKKVAVFSGHMIDKPDRPTPRFPATKEGVVRAKLAAQLEQWQIGPGDLALCGGARGGDILFAELCLARGAHVRLLIALDEGEFLQASVRLPGNSDWANRYFQLKKSCEVWFQPDRIGEAPQGVSVYERNNLWIINTARVESPPDPLYAALVWDEQSSGDGPGGTSHFAEQVRHFGGLVEIINPTKI